jgi:protein-S-isoprenylcysteine O-methyltransferase Ste14
MLLIPDFKIGLWNAWIFIIPLLAIHIVSVRVLNARGAETQPGKSMMIIFLLLHIIPFFMPLSLDTFWFYIGFIVYLFGIILLIMAIIGLASSSKDKPVTKGIFRITRNPMYISGIFLFLGIAAVSMSWIYAIIILIWFFLMVNSISEEESECLKKYGPAYREYMDRTPRWIGFLK